MTRYEINEALAEAWWARRLRQLRKQRHLSLSDLKALFDEDGGLTVSIAALSRWESLDPSKRRTPIARYRRRLAEVYGYEPHELFEAPPEGWCPPEMRDAA